MPTGIKKFWLSCQITEEERTKLFLLAQKNESTVSATLAEIVRKFLAENDVEVG